MFFQHVNDEAAQHFEAESEDSLALELMNSLVLPCLASLGGCEDDVADIKNKWCMFLSNDNLSSK